MSQNYGYPAGYGMQPARKNNAWLIVGIIAAVILIVTCCCIAIAVIMSVSGPVIFGPAIGNIFENIVEGLE